MTSFIVAHQGGWDEFLFFAVPVALGVWALRYTEKKSRLAAEAKERTQQKAVDANSDDAPPRADG